MEEFEFDNILDQSEIDNLFSDDSTEEPLEENPSTSSEEKPDNNKNNTVEETVNPENLFSPESVDSNEEDDGSQEPKDNSGKTSPQGRGSSPNIYSSIASALRGDGILDFDENTEINSSEDFGNVVEQYIQNEIDKRFDERQKRIDDALNYGMSTSDVNNYEKTIDYLDSINDETLEDESSNGEELRKNLIYNDYINRGFSKERALKEVQRSIDSGTDIEDAKEALSSNKDFYNKKYKEFIDTAKERAKEIEEKEKESSEQLKKSILESNSFLGNLSVDKSTRQKAYDAITKPFYKDPNNGKYYTEIQKYANENKNEFWKNIGILYAVTDGFKNIDKVVKTNVKKEVRKNLRNLEHVINNSSIQSDGSLSYMSGVNADDNDSYIGKGIQLDI